MSAPEDKARPFGRGAAAFLYAIFFLSGVAGLGYEIAWTRMWSQGLGHEVPAMLAVVAAFFGGLAVGARALDGPVSRSSRPERWYVGLELVLAAWALLTIWLIPWGNALVAHLTGVLPSAARHWVVAFGVPFVTLLPATAAMGATLPTMDRILSRRRGSGRHVGGLYAINTLGAVVGTLGSAFVLLPAWGLSTTVAALAGLNLLVAAAVALGARSGPSRAGAEDAPPAGARVRLMATLFCTGLLGIGFEVLGVRVIGQVLENTVYSFACALAIYLVGTALGAALGQRIATRASFERRLTFLLHATTVACLLGVFAMAHAREVYAAVAVTPGFGRAIAAELTLAAAVFLLPAMAMGATFAHLAQSARHSGGGVGAALSFNTLGGAVAPLLFGVVLLPALGSKWALVAGALGYLLLLPRWTLPSLVPALLAGALVWALPTHLRLVEPLPGGRVVEYREGVMASVSVVSDAEGEKFLKVNDRFGMGGFRGTFGARRLGHLPLLLHPAPERALFLGLGSGMTFYPSGWHPGLQARCVELLPEVVDLRSHFFTAEDRFDPTRQSVVAADARRYVQAVDERYDVIIADLFHPARDGSGSLYTREHFAAVRERLEPDGLFCQWLPLFQLEPEVLKVIVRTFLDVFEDSEAFLADFNTRQPVLGLVGRRAPRVFGPGWYEQRVTDAGLAAALGRVGLRSSFQVLGCYLGESAGLAEFAGSGPLNLDDRPVVTYLAPRQVYTHAAPASENLRALLALPADARRLIAGPEPERTQLAERLEQYWTARDFYLDGQAALTSDVRMKSLLDSVVASTDFATSYHILLQDVVNEGRAEPVVARALLDALIRAHPHRPEARSLRREMFGH